MKTLQIIGNSAFGGATRLVTDWCRYLVDHGCDVDVITTDFRSVEEFEQIEGIRVKQEVFIPREIAPVKDLIAAIKLYSLLKNENYQVIHTYSATPSIVGRVIGFLARTPIILHHQAGWTVNEANSGVKKIFFQILEGFSIAISTKSICVSHAIRKQADSLPLVPKTKLVTICNGIDASRFFQLSHTNNRISICSELKIDPNSVIIANTGRLALQKDNVTLLLAIAKLLNNSQNQSFILLLAGDGPERENLEAMSKSLGIDGNVRFLGFRSDIPELLSAIDIFVSPSLWEGLSISILEAMAIGLPIVATDILPNVELIDDKVSGILVPQKSPDAIAEAIIFLIKNPGLAKKFGESASEKVLNQYTQQRMFEETFELYKQL